MTPARATAFRWDDIPLERVTEMVARKIVIADGQMMAQTYLKKGAIVPQHRHDAPQVIYVLQGALRAVVGGEEITIREGEVLSVPAGHGHQAEALDDTFVLDVRGA